MRKTGGSRRLVAALWVWVCLEAKVISYLKPSPLAGRGSQIVACCSEDPPWIAQLFKLDDLIPRAAFERLSIARHLLHFPQTRHERRSFLLV